MHTVVNHLPIRPGADWTAMAAKFDAFIASLRTEHPAIRAGLFTRVSPTEAMFIRIYDDEATMQHVSSHVSGPWFTQNIRPYLAGPASRSTAEVIAGWTR